MPDPVTNAEPSPPSGGPPGQYVVVARRYRPQTFDQLLGQQHVAQALTNAITTQRVGHAYLFTGARGVGKTSAARIMAKALNCERGPAAVPCNQCDTCLSISTGDDVDVLEIDGASNRGIDEIRQLRQNVNVRPSRSRFKIYIIDEVHMLTREAFNALLKTLEEPPEHVKFIFCTTEATKIPVTILSRCQRFDFAGISTRAIAERLRQIVAAEGVTAEPEALEILARRAAGSMRDSQSLLEQLLSFASGRITVADVHGMLGTAGDQRLRAIIEHLARRDAASALAELDGATSEGVDVGQLLEQLLGYFRDCMAAAAGCPADSFLYASGASSQEVAEAGKQMGLATVLAAMQILDQTLSRLRYSTQGRILAELALVRLCELEELDELAALVEQLQSGRPAGAAAPAAAHSPGAPRAAAVKKNIESPPNPTAVAPGPAAPDRPAMLLTQQNAAQVWSRALEKLSGMIVEQARRFCCMEVVSPARLVIAFKPEYSVARSTCQRQVQQFERALLEVTGERVALEFILAEDAADAEPARRPILPQQRLQEVAKHPLVSRAGELFGAQPLWVEEPSD
jgi:DNA polymerase-3 subunit gamma/tau